MSFTVDLFRNAHRIVGVRMRFVLGMKAVTLFVVNAVVNAEFQFFDYRFLCENNTIWGGGVPQNRIEYPVRSISLPQVLI